MCSNCEIAQRIYSLAEDINCSDDGECDRCEDSEHRVQVRAAAIEALCVALEDIADELDGSSFDYLAEQARRARRMQESYADSEYVR